MEQESNPDVKPDVKFLLFEEKPDFQSLPVTVETTSLHSETDQDSSYPFTEQKPDIKLFFLKDELNACSVASPSSPDVCASVSTPSLDLNQYCDNPEWSKQQSIESVKSEPDSQACSDGSTEEKPCIAALRALVEDYSRSEEKKDEELERTPARSTEISSPELPKDDTCFVPFTSFQASYFLLLKMASLSVNSLKRKHKTLTLETRLKLLSEVANMGKTQTKKEIAEKYGIPTNTHHCSRSQISTADFKKVCHRARH
ncbi:hypothetical protein PoB_006241000 [Plakobranchus ocellatus]|uniref:HTH psq-type domain-containing protein n=1 Tax=Plakobranchus ocellatus TaxID=259542 RepID=A0AAV4CVL7_9GAST|nr:hypothetical protein PoB_006241000 [Plakobranchus ocellatus]